MTSPEQHSTDLKGFEAFRTLTALKLHFKKGGKYDYFQNSGKVSSKLETFQKKNDKYFYVKLAKNYPDPDDLGWYCLANVLDNQNIWIGDLLKEEAKQKYLKRIGIIDKLPYVFEEDCEVIMDAANKRKLKFDQIFNIVNDEQYPLIVSLVLSDKITIESYIVLNEILKFQDNIDNILDDPYIYDSLKWKCEKYKPFIMDINMDVYKDILERISEYLYEKPVDNTKQ